MISAITTKIPQYADRAIGFVNRTASKAMETKVANTLMPENPTDIAKMLALVSTTTKDAVNCYYYTTQSYNNQRIPEDKRKFVAGIDLANGILNVAIQLTLGLIVNKLSDKWYERMFKGGFIPTQQKVNEYLDKTNNFLQKSELTKHIHCTPEEMKKGIKCANKVIKSGFGVVVVLLTTQIFAKRVIVPFLSTPLAGIFKNALEKRDAQKATPEQKNVSNAVAETKPQVATPVQAPTSAHGAFKGFEQFFNK